MHSSDPLPGRNTATLAHIPVLLRPLLAAVAPVQGVWADGTFGAGGYAKGLLAAGADRVIGIDRDPLALEMATTWAADYGPRLTLVAGNFSELDALAGEPLDGVVLDLGVSSMQIDRPERGFSFQKDGMSPSPLLHYSPLLSGLSLMGFSWTAITEGTQKSLSVAVFKQAVHWSGGGETERWKG